MASRSRAGSASHLHLDHQLCFALYTASRAITRAYGPLLDELGLTYPQYLVMLALWEDPATALTVGELGTRLHLDSGTLTPLLKRLEANGLVTRRRDPADERRVLVEPTAAGSGLRRRAERVPPALFSCLGLELPEARELIGTLHRLTATVEASLLPDAG